MPTRELTSHKLTGLNDALKIEVLDEPGAGGANHEYRLTLDPDRNFDRLPLDISFQNGPILEAGFNGFSNEALLAIVEDRLKGFQGGQFACRENAIALTHVQDALHWLMHRTRERLARGVEGTLQK